MRNKHNLKSYEFSVIMFIIGFLLTFGLINLCSGCNVKERNKREAAAKTNSVISRCNATAYTVELKGEAYKSDLWEAKCADGRKFACVELYSAETTNVIKCAEQ